MFKFLYCYKQRKPYLMIVDYYKPFSYYTIILTINAVEIHLTINLFTYKDCIIKNTPQNLYA